MEIHEYCTLMANTLIKKNDPFGLAIADYWKKPNQRAIQLFINGKKEPSMLASYFFRSFAKMNKPERVALQLSKGKILDVGAAAGCHSIILYKRGLDVTSLDNSAHACKVMQERGLEKVVHAHIENYNEEKYDTILLLMNGFGIAGLEENLPGFMAHLKSLLKRGGHILGDSTDISYYHQSHKTTSNAHKSDYVGDVNFKIKYKDHETAIPWTYPNIATIEKAAKACNMKMQLITQVASGGFLVRLS